MSEEESSDKSDISVVSGVRIACAEAGLGRAMEGIIR